MAFSSRAAAGRAEAWFLAACSGLLGGAAASVLWPRPGTRVGGLAVLAVVHRSAPSRPGIHLR